MLQATSQTLRLFADETSRAAVLDANTGSTPQAWARAATTFQVGLASLAAIVDVSNLASVTLEAAAFSNRDGSRILSATVAGSALDNSVTQANWTAGTAQHALFSFTGAQMNFLALGTLTASYWIVISGITTGGAPIVFATGTLTVTDPGTFFTASTPPANPGAYLTIDQGDARYAPVGSSGLATNITSVGDGAAGSLEHVVTVGLAIPALRTVLIAATGELQDWVLSAGTDATDATHQRPADYNASTNPRVWVRKR